MLEDDKLGRKGFMGLISILVGVIALVVVIPVISNTMNKDSNELVTNMSILKLRTDNGDTLSVSYQGPPTTYPDGIIGEVRASLHYTLYDYSPYIITNPVYKKETNIFDIVILGDPKTKYVFINRGFYVDAILPIVDDNIDWSNMTFTYRPLTVHDISNY